jgi:hypothetical protein
MNDVLDAELEDLRTKTIHLITDSMARMQEDPRVSQLDPDRLLFALAMTAFTKILDATLDFHGVHGDERVLLLMELVKQTAALDGIDVGVGVAVADLPETDDAKERLH